MDRRMTNSQARYESVKRASRLPLVVALGALAFPGNAAARPKAVTPEPQPALTAPLVINPAAVIKDRLVHKQQVTFDAFQGVNWGANESNETAVPLTAQVDGHTDYFSVTQTRPNKFGTLKTLRVTELVDLAPDALVAETFPGITSEASSTQSGVLMVVNSNKEPAVEVPGVAYSNGKPLFALVGQTVPNPNAQTPVAQP
jgi:hypothetical protein